ncbi:hypothetical protein [Austwickia chelonae]|uniref:hypothetical protein n=1 Tax=Austwickia chelonae TaxID=100225 RepID=UPI000E24DFC2|nr:hypothetical protein [Austwickia chelonae]
MNVSYDRVSREAALLAEALAGSTGGAPQPGQERFAADRADPVSEQTGPSSNSSTGRSSPRWAQLASRAALLARDGFVRVGASLEEWAQEAPDGVRSPAGSQQETRGRHGGRSPAAYRRAECKDIPVTDEPRR